MANIKRILGKKTWTGKDAGIIAVASLADHFRQVREGIFPPVPLITPEEFCERYKPVLMDPGQAETSASYSHLRFWLEKNFARGESIMQEAQGMFLTILGYITRARDYEECIKYVHDMRQFLSPQQLEASGETTKNFLANIPRQNLTDFFPAPEGDEVDKDRVSVARRALLRDYDWARGFNIALDLIAKAFDIPNLKYMKLRLDTLVNNLEIINESQQDLYKLIAQSQHDDKSTREKKLQAMSDYFSTIDYKAMKLPKANIEKAKSLLQDHNIFYDNKIDIHDYLTVNKDMFIHCKKFD